MVERDGPPRLMEDPRFAHLHDDAPLEGAYDLAGVKARVLADAAVMTTTVLPQALLAKLGAGSVVVALVVVGGVATWRQPKPVAAAHVVQPVAQQLEPQQVTDVDVVVPPPAMIPVVEVPAKRAPRITPRAAAAAPSSTLAAEVEHYERGMAALATGRLDDALALFHEHGARWPQSQLRPEVSMSQLEALLRADRFAEARALGERLLGDAALAGRHREIRAALAREEMGTVRALPEGGPSP